MYTDRVIEHFSNPRNVGVIDEPDGLGKVESAICGDLMELYIRVKNDAITDVKYRTFGCAAAIASSSMASEMIKGLPLTAVAEITDESIAEALGGLPENKIHCSVLAAAALRAAVEDYYSRRPELCHEQAGACVSAD